MEKIVLPSSGQKLFLMIENSLWNIDKVLNFVPYFSQSWPIFDPFLVIGWLKNVKRGPYNMVGFEFDNLMAKNSNHFSTVKFALKISSRNFSSNVLIREPAENFRTKKVSQKVTENSRVQYFGRKFYTKEMVWITTHLENELMCLWLQCPPEGFSTIRYGKSLYFKHAHEIEAGKAM